MCACTLHFLRRIGAMHTAWTTSQLYPSRLPLTPTTPTRQPLRCTHQLFPGRVRDTARSMRAHFEHFPSHYQPRRARPHRRGRPFTTRPFTAAPFRERCECIAATNRRNQHALRTALTRTLAPTVASIRTRSHYTIPCTGTQGARRRFPLGPLRRDDKRPGNLNLRRWSPTLYRATVVTPVIKEERPDTLLRPLRRIGKDGRRTRRRRRRSCLFGPPSSSSSPLPSPSPSPAAEPSSGFAAGRSSLRLGVAPSDVSSCSSAPLPPAAVSPSPVSLPRAADTAGPAGDGPAPARASRSSLSLLLRTCCSSYDLSLMAIVVRSIARSKQVFPGISISKNIRRSERSSADPSNCRPDARFAFRPSKMDLAGCKSNTSRNRTAVLYNTFIDFG